jgi:hypothetical protein
MLLLRQDGNLHCACVCVNYSDSVMKLVLNVELCSFLSIAFILFSALLCNVFSLVSYKLGSSVDDKRLPLVLFTIGNH